MAKHRRGKNNEQLNFRAAKSLLCEISTKRKFPLRGKIPCGEFSTRQNCLLRNYRRRKFPAADMEKSIDSLKKSASYGKGLSRYLLVFLCWMNKLLIFFPTLMVAEEVEFKVAKWHFSGKRENQSGSHHFSSMPAPSAPSYRQLTVQKWIFLSMRHCGPCIEPSYENIEIDLLYPISSQLIYFTCSIKLFISSIVNFYEYEHFRI